MFRYMPMMMLLVTSIASACDVGDPYFSGMDVRRSGAGDGTIQVTGNCPGGHCKVFVKYKVEYASTANMNGWPITTAGAETFDTVFTINDSGYFSEEDDARFVLPACGMSECSVINTKAIRAECED